MKSLCTSIIAVIFAIVLILSFGVNMPLARAHPPSPSAATKSLSASQVLSHSESEREGTKNEIAASLRRIPPSRSNPTQNKLKPRMG